MKRKKTRGKQLLRHTSAGNVRTLFRNKDRTYTVKVDKWDFDTDAFSPPIEHEFTSFGDALNYANFKPEVTL